MMELRYREIPLTPAMADIVSVIAVPDLMYQAGLVVSTTFLPMEVYTIIALMYFLIVMIISLIVRWAVKKLPAVGYFQIIERE